MFAVVEFFDASNEESSFDVSIVPLIWLHKNDTKCYWPSVVPKGRTFEEFIKSQPHYKSYWPRYKVYKVHCKTDSYEMAEKQIKALLCNTESETSNSSSKSFTKKVVQMDQESSDESSEPERTTDENADITVKEKKSDERGDNTLQDIITPMSTNEVVQSFEDTTELINLNDISLGSFLAPTNNNEYVITTSQTPVSFTCSSLKSSSCVSTDFEQTVISTLTTIKENIEQHSLILGQLLKQANVNNSQLNPPDNVPNLPVKTIEEFNDLEALLENDPSIYQYMVRRLAAIGGNGISALTRRIMKYLLLDEVCLLFNWKGRD